MSVYDEGLSCPDVVVVWRGHSADYVITGSLFLLINRLRRFTRREVVAQVVDREVFGGLRGRFTLVEQFVTVLVDGDDEASGSRCWSLAGEVGVCNNSYVVALKLSEVYATTIVFVFVLYCILLCTIKTMI